jgi:xylulokinase
MAWIAIDAGTTVIKAVAFGRSGEELALARENTNPLRLHPGHSEQNMEATWQAVISTVRQVAQRCGESIEGIVSTAQGDGCWLMDAAGRPVRDAILWNDGRANKIVEQWRENGILDDAFRLSGSVSYPGLPNAILRWLQVYEPESLNKARWMLTCNGWIFARMTGRIAADLSDASNPFSDVHAKMYSPSLLKSFGLENISELLAPIARNHEVSAPLLEEAAQKMNVPAQIPMVMAPYDIVTTAFGCGVSLSGQACVILGTTICTETITDSLDLTGKSAGTTIALENGHYLRAMPTLTGCEAQEWAAKLLTRGSLEQLSHLAAECKPALQLPFFLPYLSPAGERAPFLAPEASGSFHGLSLSTSPSRIAHAIYEGLSFVIRECLRTATKEPVNEIRVAGGGARSDLWCQMIADVAGINVIRTAGNEHGARGAYLSALALTNQIENIPSGIQRFIRDEQAFIPCSENHDLYLLRYRTWHVIRETTCKHWPLLRGMQ